MARPMIVIKLIMRAFRGRFLIARMTRLPILGGLIEGALFENDDIIYLPQDVSIEVNRPIDVPGSVVLPSQVLEHFINQASFHWIMDWCICRRSAKCKHYPSELGCLFLGQAAMKIDPRLGHPATKEEALDHLRKCQEAGLVQLVGRNKLDAVWLDVGPGNKLLTICNCCPCCCLWKMLPSLNSSISSKVTKMPGVEVTVNEHCVGCGTCAQGVCFVKAITVKDGHAVISQDCRGCGRCVSICPNRALELKIVDPSFFEKSIDRISNVVDVN